MTLPVPFRTICESADWQPLFIISNPDGGECQQCRPVSWAVFFPCAELHAKSERGSRIELDPLAVRASRKSWTVYKPSHTPTPRRPLLR